LPGDVPRDLIVIFETRMGPCRLFSPKGGFFITFGFGDERKAGDAAF
jgi:hypothetical protein